MNILFADNFRSSLQVHLALDLDGTLISCRQKQVGLMHAIAKAHKIELSSKVFWELKRSGENNFNALCKIGIPANCSKTLCELWKRNIENVEWQALDSVFPHVKKFLSDKTIKYSLITARSSYFSLHTQLLRLGLTKYFENIIVVSPVNAPENKAFYLRALGCDFFIGDSEVDCRAAQIANCKFVGVGYGQRSHYFLSKMGVNRIIYNPGGLLELKNEIIPLANSTKGF